MFMVALFTIVKRWKQSTHRLIDKWINKMWYIHAYKGIVALKKEGCSVTCDNMDQLKGHYTHVK